MAADSSALRSRRALLGAVLGSLGVAVASRFASPDRAAAADGDAVTAGNSFTATAATQLENTTAAGTSLIGHHASDGTGVLGDSASGKGVAGTAATGTGIVGRSTESSASTFVDPSARTGVIGTAGDLTNAAQITDEIGVYGFSDVSFNSVGVVGDTIDGIGTAGDRLRRVIGLGDFAGVLGDVGTSSVGVYGNVGASVAAAPPPGVGVYARARTTAQTAQWVNGKVKFSRSGRTSITAGHSSRIVMSGVSTSSYVVATLQTRRTSVYVHPVVPASGAFTIYLNKAVSGTTYIGFLVIN